MDLRRRNKQHVMETVEGKDPPSVEGTSFRGCQFD